jgi:hypothetical protein
MHESCRRRIVQRAGALIIDAGGVEILSPDPVSVIRDADRLYYCLASFRFFNLAPMAKQTIATSTANVASAIISGPMSGR